MITFDFLCFSYSVTFKTLSLVNHSLCHLTTKLYFVVYFMFEKRLRAVLTSILKIFYYLYTITIYEVMQTYTMMNFKH